MFCDLVGSTALSQHFDPEDLRDLIAAYREVCAGVLRRGSGRIARYVGDGLLIYFGYPNAHDDDARMAVRAALQIVEALHDNAAKMVRRAGTELHVRIGIHTGLVVAGDLRSGEDCEMYSIVGETPNLAARLQEAAEPDMALISEATYSLVKHQFVCRAMGERQVKGFSKPLRVYSPLAEREIHNSKEAFDIRELTPLEGREQELLLLAKCWDRVRDGMGQAALISGDPGIGKSRLVYACQLSITEEHSFLASNCSPHWSNSAFMPLTDLLYRELRFTGLDSAAEREAKLNAALTVAQIPLQEGLPLIASLLSVPLSSDYQLPDLSPESRREKTIEVLLMWLLRQSERQPLILVLEDIHWADASTLEVIKLLLGQVPTARLLLLLTFRPEFHSDWGVHSYLMHLTLSRLSSRETEGMIENLTRGTELPSDLRTQLVKRADGVPLFVEELTKAILEARVLRGEGNAIHAAASQEDTIPASLRDSLMARLDRLNSVKLTAQIAATLGREFSFELLQAVAPLSKEELLDALSQLVEGEFLFQRGLPPRARYSFKHALIQEAAYQSLLRAARRRCHLRTAEAIVGRFPEIAERQPELIAEHFQLAGRTEQAIVYWQSAGERALERYANIEAVAHLKSALAAVDQLPASRERTEDAIKLLTAIGTAITAIEGYGASEAEHVFARAQKLCRAIGDTPQLFPTLRGLQSYYQVRGPLESARQIGGQLLRLAEGSQDRSLNVEARRALGWCLFCLGELRQAKEQLDAALDQYDPGSSQQNIRMFGSDAGVLGLVNLGWVELCLGNSDRATELAQDAIRLGKVLAHPLSLAYALCMSAAIHQGLRQPELTERLAAETLALATENKFRYWIGWSTILRGWAIAEMGDVAEGLNMLREGLAAYRATGAELFRPYSLALLAETCGKAGNRTEGIDRINEAIASSAAINVHFFDAELFRLKAWLSARNGSKPQLLMEMLQFAARIAALQGAKMLELRVRNDLEDLRHDVFG